MISNPNVVVGNSVLRNGIAVEGTGTSPVVPVSATYVGGDINVSDGTETIVAAALQFGA